MRRVPSSFLKSGMITGSHIYTLDGRILLAKGVELTDGYIDKLVSKGIPFVYIDDDISRDIFISDVILDETRLKAKNHIRKAISNMDSFDYQETKSVVNEIIEQLLSNRDILYDLEDIRSVDDYLFGHSVNVCVLSVIIGISMNYNSEQLENLAVGALLHDIGKGMVPSHILHKAGKLTSDEFEEIKNHSKYSLEILRKNDSISSVSRIIAYQHHERYNREGYPQGLGGKEILDMAQIVGMADVYDAITSDRCYGDAISPNEAYELLAGSGDYYFKYSIVQKFLFKLVLYPTGTMIELSTDEIGIVVKNTLGYPTKPIVRMLYNSDFSPIEPYKEFDLFQFNNITIRRVLSEAEVVKISSSEGK
ncbi:MAG: HD-GYP domain-containing protein [Peptococcaceae bacterium]|nr:HD-GYP domain-containing protein [Peptococcaceae bacterium]